MFYIGDKVYYMGYYGRIIEYGHLKGMNGYFKYNIKFDDGTTRWVNSDNIKKPKDV